MELKLVFSKTYLIFLIPFMTADDHIKFTFKEFVKCITILH